MLAAAVEGIDFAYHKGEQESTGGEASDESAAAFFDEWRAANDPLSAWIEGIIQANLSLQTLAASLGGFFGALTSVNLILNFVQTILGSMYDVLGPLIDTILAPIVGILRILGTTLGQILAPILSWFGPILSTLAMGFAWFYNSVILPIGNSLISVGNLIYNGIVTAINAMLGWIGVHFDTVHLTSGHLEKIDLATLSAAGMTSGAVSTAGGRSAQYSGGTINNIDVVVNTAALVGTDGVSEFAIMIGREIQSSGVLGRE
jgi:phage-related protein